MTAGVRRIIPLTLGWADLPRSVSVEGASDHEMLREPVPGVLLLCDGGWLLLDTGYNTALITDPGAARPVPRRPAGAAGAARPRRAAGGGAGRGGRGPGRHPRGRRQPPALRPRGRPQALRRPGAGAHPAGRARLRHVQRRPGPEENGIFRVDFDDPRIDWRTAEGDTEIAPGVTAVLTAGHTPGHQSFVVRIDPSAGGGGFVFAFDAADLTENIDREVAVGGRIGASAGAERGPDPQAQADRHGARLPAGARARPGRLARAHRGAGGPGPAQMRPEPARVRPSPQAATPGPRGQPSGSMPFTAGTRTVRWPGLPPRMT